MKEVTLLDERQFAILTETIREGLQDIKQSIVSLAEARASLRSGSPVIQVRGHARTKRRTRYEMRQASDQQVVI
jgi:hypothetical protein